MNISELSHCANCGACYNICPQDAIFVNKESLFYDVTVDLEKCIDCGKCVAICPVENSIDCNSPAIALAGWHKDDKIVLSSSSGGAFYALADYVTKSGGLVFGAAYSDDFKGVEIKSTDEVSLSQLQKSKYVESCVESSFERVNDELKKGRRVLFCGTPCQVAGLKSFLGGDMDLLITCDFACGGVPSHTLFSLHISNLEKKYKSQASSVDFRPKTYGWNRYSLLVRFKNGKKYNRLAAEDAYLKSFLYGKRTVRPYCLECKFSDHHQSDITLADFWKYKELSSLSNDDGISLLLINTKKGEKIVSLLKEQFLFEELDITTASYNNKPSILDPEQIKAHDQFLELCVDRGLNEAAKETFTYTVKSKIRRWLSKLIHRRARRGEK